MFGFNSFCQLDKYHITKSQSLLSFPPYQQLNHYCVISASLRWKKKIWMFMHREKCNSYKTVNQCEFFVWLFEKQLAKGGIAGRKLCVFFPPWFFIVKRQWTIFSEAQKMCSERGQWLDLPRQCSFLLPLFYFLYCGLQKKKRFKWHLTLLLAEDMACSS